MDCLRPNIATDVCEHCWSNEQSSNATPKQLNSLLAGSITMPMSLQIAINCEEQLCTLALEYKRAQKLNKLVTETIGQLASSGLITADC